ncbi:hypothetical protein BRD19_11515 [Halobacteriales archaeon SW_7_65_23]|nr:MAG: hypothetical protein BRD19_11515 [Halobacteriales archaeon SW_7_65_23]
MSKRISATDRIAALPGKARKRLATTGSLVGGLLRRPGTLAIVLVVTLGYLTAFLIVMQDFTFDLGVGFSSFVVDQPLDRMFEPGPGHYQYEAIAVLDVWIGTWVFSPLNTAIGLVISLLVGLNLALTYLAVTQPKSCGIEAGTGVLAAVPALFAGSACCGPVIFLVIGIQAGGVLLTAFQWLLPAAVVLLLGGLFLVAGRVDPTAV